MSRGKELCVRSEKIFIKKGVGKSEEIAKLIKRSKLPIHNVIFVRIYVKRSGRMKINSMGKLTSVSIKRNVDSNFRKVSAE